MKKNKKKNDFCVGIYHKINIGRNFVNVGDFIKLALLKKIIILYNLK